MTEEEREKLRQAKIDVSEKLASTEIGRYRLTEVDDRLDQYVREVAGNPDGHNLYEQLAVAHFFDMCDRYGVNVTEVLQFFDFYESGEGWPAALQADSGTGIPVRQHLRLLDRRSPCGPGGSSVCAAKVQQDHRHGITRSVRHAVRRR